MSAPGPRSRRAQVKGDLVGTHLSSSPSRSFSLTAFSFQNCSDSCGGDHVRWPDSSSDVYSSHVLQRIAAKEGKSNQPSVSVEITYPHLPSAK